MFFDFFDWLISLFVIFSVDVVFFAVGPITFLADAFVIVVVVDTVVDDDAVDEATLSFFVSSFLLLFASPFRSFLFLYLSSTTQ